ncbi:hypothetical protein STEG23_035235 [Scotinomys teguina]
MCTVVEICHAATLKPQIRPTHHEPAIPQAARALDSSPLDCKHKVTDEDWLLFNRYGNRFCSDELGNTTVISGVKAVGSLSVDS